MTLHEQTPIAAAKCSDLTYIRFPILGDGVKQFSLGSHTPGAPAPVLRIIA